MSKYAYLNAGKDLFNSTVHINRNKETAKNVKYMYIQVYRVSYGSVKIIISQLASSTYYTNCVAVTGAADGPTRYTPPNCTNLYSWPW